MPTSPFAGFRSGVYDARRRLGVEEARPSDEYSAIKRYMHRRSHGIFPDSQAEPFAQLDPQQFAASEDPAVRAEWERLTPTQRAYVVMSRPSDYLRMDRGQRRAVLGMAPLDEAALNAMQEGNVLGLSREDRLGEIRDYTRAKDPVLGRPQTPAAKLSLDVENQYVADREQGMSQLEEQALLGKAPGLVNMVDATGKGRPSVQITNANTRAGKKDIAALAADGFEERKPSQITGTPSDFAVTPTMKTQLQREANEAGKSRDRMLSVMSSYNPDLQKLRSKVGAKWIGWRAAMEGAIPWVGKDASPEDVEFVTDVRNQHQQVAAAFSEEAHRLYGAALTAVELPRAQAAIPHPDMNPVELQAAMQTSMRIADYAIAKLSVFEEASQLPNGPMGPQEMDRIDVAQYLDTQARAELDKVIAENPEMSGEEALDKAIQRVEKRYNITPGGYDRIVADSLMWLQEMGGG